MGADQNSIIKLAPMPEIEPPSRSQGLAVLDFAGPEIAQALLDTAPVIVLVLDRAGCIVHYNGFMERLCRRPVAELRGRDWFAEFLLDDERDHARALFRRSLESTPVPARIIGHICVHGGEPRLIEWHDRKLCDAAGEVSQLLAIGIDITDFDMAARPTTEQCLRGSLVELELELARLVRVLGEKDALLQEIHHRVKNNLQVVASLLYLQGVDAAPEIRAVLDECSTRIHSMALIHEQLHVSNELSLIDIHDFLEQLGEELVRVFVRDRAIGIRVGGGGLHLCIERAVPVALIANELLTNALKYAYPDLPPGDKAEVRVEVGADLIEIADDGIGLPADLDRTTPSSLGLRLVRALARQLGARLEFGAGPGTCIRLQLPRV